MPANAPASPQSTRVPRERCGEAFVTSGSVHCLATRAVPRCSGRGDKRASGAPRWSPTCVARAATSSGLHGSSSNGDCGRSMRHELLCFTSERTSVFLNSNREWERLLYANIFEHPMRANADMVPYHDLAVAIYEQVSFEPRFEFLDLNTFATSRMGGVMIERFSSPKGARLWASRPDHKKVMRRGQLEFSAWYRGSRCLVDHEFEHPSPIEDES